MKNEYKKEDQCIMDRQEHIMNLHEGYSISIRVHSLGNILMGDKLDGINESMQNSSIRLYNNDEAIEIMTGKIWNIKNTKKS